MNRYKEEAKYTRDDELSTSSHIKLIHDYFEKLSLEADNKLLDASFYKPSQLEIAKSLTKNCEIFKPLRSQDRWDWLHEASKLFHIHLRDASSYHEYKLKLKDLTREVELLKERTKVNENEDAFDASENVRKLLEKFLDLQLKVERLHKASHRVVPIHLRRLPCQQNQPIVSIGSFYDINDKLIEENSELFLLDNSNASRWKVRDKQRGRELFVPSLLFTFFPPDAGLIQEACKLRHHLISVWKFCADEGKNDLINKLMKQIGKGLKYEITSAQKSKLLDTLNASKNLIMNGDKRQNSIEFEKKLKKYSDDVRNLRPSTNSRGHASFDTEWSGYHDLVENLKEMCVYMNTYSGSVSSQICSKNHVVRHEDPSNKPHFKSCAYIQRWPNSRPNPSKDVHASNMMMMIYEVGNNPPNLTSEPNPTSNSSRPLNSNSSRTLNSNPTFTSSLKGEVEEVVEERWREVVEETQFTSQTIKETQKFFIRGVFDPRSGKNISSQRAIDTGIIDLKRGLYRNPVTREDILIPEAMDRGLIVVEYSNKMVEMGELIKSGIFKTFTKKEVVSYVILSIKDPKTGRNVLVEDAIKSGLIDQDQGRFVLNKDSGDAISIESAIDKGFLEVKELNRQPIVKEEPSNVKVVGVYDIVGKHFIPLQQALRREVMDKNTAALRNKATGETIPLKEAVTRGLVLLEISPGNDANSLKNFPVLKQEDFDEIMHGVADGYSADPIVELMADVSDESLFYDPSNSEQMSLKRAIISSRVGFDPLVVTLQDGSKFALHEALLNGILDLKGVDELLKVTRGKRSLLKLVEDERLDLTSGDYVDLATRQRKPLSEAVESKQINPSLIFYWDDQSQVATSLKGSLDNGRLKDGKVFDFKNNDWVTMEAAVNRGLVGLEVNSEDLMEKYSSLVLLKNLIPNNGSHDGLMIDGRPIEDAVMRGKFDLGRLQISSDEGFVSLPRAVEKNLIDRDAAKKITDVAHENDLDNFFVSHKTFDPSTSRIEHPTTGRKITFLQAVKDGVINPNSIFVVDCSDGDVKSMKKLAEEGKFNLETGRIKDANTGRERSLLDAIKNGLVQSTVDPDQYLDQTDTVESIVKSGSKNKYITLKNGEKMKLEDAMAEGFVDSKTRMRKEGGRNGGGLTFDDDVDGDVIVCLKEVATMSKLLDRYQDQFIDLKNSKNPNLNDFENLRSNLESFRADVDGILEKFDEVDSKSKNFDKLKTSADKLNNTFRKLESDLDSEVTKRGHVDRRINQALDRLIGLKESISGLEEEMKELNREASDPNFDLKTVIDHAQDVDLRLQPKLEELLDVESHCTDLMDFLRSPEIDPDNKGRYYRNNPNLPRITDTLKQLNISLNKLNSDLPELTSDLLTASKNQDEFAELEESFLDKLVAMENDIANVNMSDNMDRGEKLSTLKELADLDTNFTELESLRKDLKELGDEVDSTLRKVGRSSTSQVMEVEDLEQMRKQVAEMQARLKKSMSDDENKKNRVQRIRDDVSSLEGASNDDKLSLDRKKLIQLGDLLMRRQRNVDALRSEVEDAVDPKVTLDEDLLDRLQQIDDKAQSRRDKVVQLSDALKQFNEIKESLNSWMRAFIGRVNKKDDPRILRIKIPKLNEERSSKEADLKKLNVIGGELMSPNDVTDKGVVYKDLMNINQKWDDIADLLNHYVIIGASSEIEKLSRYLDETESKMSALEPISVDRIELGEQLKAHQKFHSDLLAKKSMGGEMVNEYSRWLGRSMVEEADGLKMKLGALLERMNVVSQSSMSRLIYLEDAVTLATHLDLSLSDLKSWLGETEADLVSAETGNDSDRTSSKMHDVAMTTFHELNDRSDLVEDLKATGLELKDLCDGRGAELVEEQVSRLVERYDEVKDRNKRSLRGFQDAVYNSNDEAYNLLLSIKNDLQFYEHVLELSFRPTLVQSVLSRQIVDLQTINDDVLKIAHVVNEIQHEMTSSNSVEEIQLLDALVEREKDLETKAATKKEELETILKLVEEFENAYANIMSALQMIQDNLASQDFPGVESTIVADQVNELSLMEEDLRHTRDQFKSCDDLVDRISSVTDPSVATELKKLLDNRNHVFSNVLEGLSVRRLDLNAASELSQKYGRHLENVAAWLPLAEDRSMKINKSRSVGLKSTNSGDLDKLCELKRDLMTSHDDVIKLKDVLSSFKVISPLSTDVLSFEVNDIETRFNALVSSINNSIGQRKVDQLDLLQPLIDRISTDQLNTKEQSWNAKMLKNELNQLQESYFDDYPSDVVPAQQLLSACRDWQDRAVQLKDRECCMENLLRWFDEFKNELIFLRALRSQPPLLRSQVEQFENKAKDFERKADEGDGMTNDIKAMEGGLEVDYLVNMLQENISNSGAVAEETERKLRDHSEDVDTFHSLIGGHNQRMGDIEASLTQQPIKSLDFHELERDLMTEKQTLNDMWRHGSELKFFGRKQDSVTINSVLLNAQLRWNKLLRMMKEMKMRSSDDESHKEKFRQQYNDLLSAFEEIGKKVNNKNVLKELLALEDEMSSTEKKLHNLNHALRNMKAGGADNDLHAMMLDLKKKWNNVHSSLISKKNKLDLALISSGKVNEAIKVQCDWLMKCIQYLDENQPLLGDLDTVAMLIDQYKNFQDDLKMHESLIESIRASNPSPASVEQLNQLWDEVVRLNDARRDKLQDAHGLASDFQEAVEKVRRILPEIEDGLKESGMNVQTEDQLLDLIDHHQKLYSKLCGEQQTVEKIIVMSEEILESCHPSATRFMQYYLTITHKRWEQALVKSNNILDRLNENLKKFRGGATVVDDLWAWLSEAQQLLVTKSKDPPPLDLATVDALIRDHQDFHEDLINKNEEIEDIVRDAQSNSLSKSQIQTLQNKWRGVWRLSVERKKMLQETLDYLLEIESLNNFNFDEWRQRYNDWIRSNKLRVTDFFRKQDVQGYGTLARNQFVDGMINSKFPSNKMELNAIFDLFEDQSTGEMPYQLLIEALKSGDRMRPRNAMVEKNPSKKVDDEVVTQISRCQCRKQFAAYKLGEGKYQFGEKGRIYLLRFVNGVVMVRVGGGWVSLTEFLQNNDPCKVKNRTNIEIYKTLQERGKSMSSLNKSVSGSTASLNMSTNQQTPKRSRTPQTTSNLLKKKNASLNHSMTSLVSIKSKESDPVNINKSADSLKSPKPGQRISFVPPKRVSTPKSEMVSAYRDTKRSFTKPPSQR